MLLSAEKTDLLRFSSNHFVHDRIVPQSPHCTIAWAALCFKVKIYTMRFPLAAFVAFAACLVVSSEPQEGNCGAGDECAAAADDMTSEEAPALLEVPNKDVIEVLVRDFFAVGRNNNEPTLAGWEAGGAKFRYMRELKDRYDFQWNRQMRLFGASSLHQFADRDAGDLSAVHGAAEALETLGKVKDRDIMLTLLDKLHSSRERTFISTEVSTLDAPQVTSSPLPP